MRWRVLWFRPWMTLKFQYLKSGGGGYDGKKDALGIEGCFASIPHPGEDWRCGRTLPTFPCFDGFKDHGVNDLQEISSLTATTLKIYLTSISTTQPPGHPCLATKQ